MSSKNSFKFTKKLLNSKEQFKKTEDYKKALEKVLELNEKEMSTYYQSFYALLTAWLSIGIPFLIAFDKERETIAIILLFLIAYTEWVLYKARKEWSELRYKIMMQIYELK